VRKGAPYLLILIPIEGRARAILVCDSEADENHFALDLSARDLLAELSEALRELADALAEEAV
jgi:hypothetical protein